MSSAIVGAITIAAHYSKIIVARFVYLSLAIQVKLTFQSHYLLSQVLTTSWSVMISSNLDYGLIFVADRSD